jgi:hypothetical protein
MYGIVHSSDFLLHAMSKSQILGKPELQLLAQNPWFEAAFGERRTLPPLPFSLHAPGLPRGAITHLQGAGRTSALLRLLAEHPGLKAAWVEEKFTAYPPGFSQAGVPLESLLFVETGDKFYWALSQVLRSQIFQVVAAVSPLRGEVELRRLQLAAETSGCVLLCLADIEGPAWPVKLWLECRDGEIRQTLDNKQLLRG